MRLRPATLADVPDLADLDDLCFPDDRWGAASLSAELSRPGALLLVAEQEARPRIAASVLAWRLFDELEILRVATHPAARRQGLGRRLLQMAESSHPELRAAFLEVRADNAAAIPLYEREGYVRFYVRRRYYHDGCDALLYRKDWR